MKTEVTSESPRLRYDIFLILALLLVAVALLALNFITRTESNYVDVTEYGKLVATYSLDVNGEHALGGGSNILVIEDGRAYVRYADCPGQHCVKTGKIHYVGESITCAYNEIIIIVKGDSEDGVDFVS